MPKSPAHEAFVVFMVDYAVFLSRMRADENDKLAALSSRELSRIEHSITVSQANAKQLENYEARRQALQAAAGYTGMSFRELIDAAPADEQNSLWQLFSRFESHVAEIRFFNDKSMAVARDNMIAIDPASILAQQAGARGNNPYERIREERERQGGLLEAKVQGCGLAEGNTAMRPTFMGFETATRGLMTNQKALDIVGNNTSNIGVTGYTRQRVDQVSLSVNMRYTRFNQNSTSFAGQGVAAYGVSQIRDDFLDKRFRQEYADEGYYTATSAVLEDLHGAMDEIIPANMSRAVTLFQDAWDQMLGKSVNETTQAANIQAQATQLVQVFRQMSAKIDNVWNQNEYSLSLDVDNINSILERVAELNDSIAHQKFNSMDVGNENYQPLELLDQRNSLLDELSNYADIYYETAGDGQVTVWMGKKDDANNPPVVVEDHAEKLDIRVNDDDPQFKTVRVFWNHSGKDVNFETGSVRGMMDMLNGRGLSMDGGRGEAPAQGIHYYKDRIDSLAKVVVSAFNSVLEYVRPADDPVAPGQPYDPPYYKALFTFENDAYENAAGIRLSTEWENDSAYIIKDLKDKLVNEGDTSNTYAAKASNVFKRTFDFESGGLVEYSGTITDYISFYSNTKLNNDKAYSDSRLETVTSISNDLLDKIQQISGVSFDEEGVDMMMYKKAYDAVSRVFTTLDEMLDKLINNTGVVGR